MRFELLMNYIRLCLCNAAGLLCADMLLHTVYIDRWDTFVIAVLVLTSMHVFIKPLIIRITLPFNVVTLGAFTLVINMWMLLVTAGITVGLYVPTARDAFFAALIIGIVNGIARFAIRVYQGAAVVFSTHQANRRMNNSSYDSNEFQGVHSMREDAEAGSVDEADTLSQRRTNYGVRQKDIIDIKKVE